MLTAMIKYVSIRKHAYLRKLKILQSKKENFPIKTPDIFHISAQNIACGYSLEPPRWGGSNEYPQSMFLSRNHKTNVYPCKPQFYHIKMGFKGVKIIWACFHDVEDNIILLTVTWAFFYLRWHLGFCNWKYTPTKRGFDSFYGFYSGAEDYYDHTHCKSFNACSQFLNS